MTIRIIEGFDHVGAPGDAASVASAGWITGGAPKPGTQMIASRWGTTYGRAAQLVSEQGWFQKLLPTGYDEIWFGCAFITNASEPPRPFFQVLNAIGGVNAQLSLTAPGGGFINLVNAAGTILATSSPRTYDGGWHYLEMRVLCAGASGSAEVWIDGVQWIPSTVGNFGTAGSTSSPAGIRLYNNDGGGDWWTAAIDDVYLLDTGTGVKNSRLGEVRVETLYPTADGAHSDFVPTTAGTHFDEVDDPVLHDSDTTVVRSNVVGDRDSYAFQDLSIASGVIHGVGVKTVARKNDAGVRTIKHSIRQAGTTYDGSIAHSLGSSHACFQTCFEQDPVAAAWTVANVNGDEYGVKVEA